MRSLDELAVEPDAWPDIARWLGAANAVVEPAVAERAGATLLALQVTTRSVLGSLAFRTAGIAVDHGWLRHLGSGGGTAGDGIQEWNASLGGAPLDPPLDGALVVARDVLGGLFAINAGGFRGEPGALQYFAPDTQAWMDLGMGHSAFVEWSLSPHLAQFYGDQRWAGWQDEVQVMGPDDALSVYPPLGFETDPLHERARRPVPAREMWTFLNELAQHATGTATSLRITVDRG